MVWLSGWTKKIKLTIDSTKIDEDLIDFPVMLKLGSTHACVFEELNNNSKKIMLIDATLGNMLYCEISYWDSVTNNAELWIKVPLVSSTEDTYIYLFYDNTQNDNNDYIGSISSTAATKVWSNNFSAVYHMSQDLITAPFTSATLIAQETIGTSSAGGVATANVNYGGINFIGVTKNNAALVIWLKVDKPNYISWSTGTSSKIIISSQSLATATNMWYLDFRTDTTGIAKYIIDNLTTTYKRFVIPLQSFITESGEVDVSNIWRLTWICQSASGRIINISWKSTELIVWPGIQDSVSISNHGKIIGALTNSSVVDGLIGKAVQFNGSDQYINCGAILSNPGKLTIEAVVKQTIIPDVVAEGIVGKYDQNYTQYMLGTNVTTGKPIFKISSTGADNLALEGITNISTINNFVYITATYNPSTEMSIFVEGIKEKSLNIGVFSSILKSDVSSFLIGSYYNESVSRRFNGIIDEVRVSSTVRSNAWIKATEHTFKNTLVTTGQEELLIPGELNYANKIKLTIPKGYIESNLVNFPVLINISSSAGFNKIDLSEMFNYFESAINRKKIAITDYTGVSQHFVEIEHWNQHEKTAQLWVKVPALSSTEDTILYLYYDKDVADNMLFVGDTLSYTAKKVWPYNFLAVYHLSSNPYPYAYDSTENNLHGISTGSIGAGNITSTNIGKTTYFNGVDNIISIPSYTNLINNNFSFECILKTNLTHEIIDPQRNSGTAEGDTGQKFIFGSNSIEQASGTESIAELSIGTNGITVYERTCVYHVATSKYSAEIGNGLNHVCIVYSNKIASIYLNGSKIWTGISSMSLITCMPQTIGGMTYGYFNGTVSQVRLSYTSLSDAWIKATYYSNLDKLVMYEIPPKNIKWLKTYESGELIPWAKRIPIEIDYTKIDSPLVEFPLLLNITDNSGITNKDLSLLFDALNITNEEVSNFSGSTLNTNIWTIDVNSPPPYSVNILSNKLVITSATTGNGSAYVQITAKYKVIDCDISIKYSNLELDGEHGIQLKLGEDTDSWFSHIGVYYNGGIRLWTRYKAYGLSVITLIDSGTTLWPEGWFRITKEGNICKTYYKHNLEDVWILRDTITVSFNTSATITIANYKTYYAEPIFIAYIDNFIVTNTILHWPTAYFLNKYKIAITQEDGVTQLPVEIERWDQANKSIQLWTKLTNVRADINTKLYLYYDLTKIDNTEYVGVIGSVKGMNVWDSNYASVYHLSQVPISNVIKDSTINTNNSNNIGILNEASIVDGSIGKATYFSGLSSNHFITPATNLSSLQNEYTVEATAKFIGNTSLTKLVYVGKGSPDAGSIVLERYNTTNYLDVGVWGDNIQSNVSIPTSPKEFVHYGNVYKNGNVKAISNGIIDSISNSVTIADLSSAYIMLAYVASAYHEVTIRSVRVSKIARNEAWLKASYNSDFDTLVRFNDIENPTVTEEPLVYNYQGYIKDKALPIVRKVLLYNRATGLLMDSTISDFTGHYLLETNSNTEHFIVVLDNEDNYTYAPLVKDRLLPNGD